MKKKFRKYAFLVFGIHVTPFNGIYNIKFNSASVVRNVRNVEEPIANCFDAYIIPVTEEEIGQEI